MAGSSSSSSSSNGSSSLLWWTLLGVVAGCVLGAALYNADCSSLTIELIGYPGELYLRAVQQLVLPLVVFSLMSGVFSTRHAKGSAGKLTRWSLGYYLMSMLLAVMIGILLVFFLRPGRHAPFAQATTSSCIPQINNSTASTLSSEDGGSSIAKSFMDIGFNLIPQNIIKAAAESNYLAVVVCAITLAFVINSFGERATSLINLIDLFNAAVMKLIAGVIRLTPIAVGSLIASTILKSCDILDLLSALGLFVATVLAGLFIHTILVLPCTVLLLCRRNPYKTLRSFLPALLMGLGTSSAAAAMPVTMNCAEASGCNSSIVRFVIPLGTSINRDGSALYEAVSVMFICQAHGLDLSLGKLFTLAIASTLAAMGCGSVPKSGLVTMITALQAIGYPQYTNDVAVLYAVDWLLDALRTSVNIWGDGCACTVVDEWFKQHYNDGGVLEPLLEGNV